MSLDEGSVVAAAVRVIGAVLVTIGAVICANSAVSLPPSTTETDPRFTASVAECPCKVDEVEGPAEGSGGGAAAFSARAASGHGGGLGGGEVGLGGGSWSLSPFSALLSVGLTSSVAGFFVFFLNGFTLLSVFRENFFSLFTPTRAGSVPDASLEVEEGGGGVMGGVLAETEVIGEADAGL